jgi:hypothetical protein
MSYRDAQRFRKVYSYYRPLPRVADNFSVDKQYIDQSMQSLDWKQSVRLASTGPITLAPGITSFDGNSLNDEDRILLKDQAYASENGIYIWYEKSQSLIRTLDASQDSLTSGATCYVESGTNAETVWTLVTLDPITIDTTPQSWVLLSGGTPDRFFTITGSHAKTTSSISFGTDFVYTNQKGSDVFFYVSGSLDGANKTVFGGDVRVSGTLALGTGSAYIRVQDNGDVVLSPHKEYIYAGSDVFFFVSGSPGDTDKSLFGGDVKSSGSMVGLGGFTGSLTQLSDGTAYLRAGSGVEITTGSLGQVTVSLAPAPKLVWTEKVGRGNGVDTIFKLKYAPCSSDTAMVFIDGVLQEHSVDLVISDFSIVGQFIIFNFIPEAGTKIVVTYSYM